MNTNQKTVFQVLTSYIPGIDQSKLQQWIESRDYLAYKDYRGRLIELREEESSMKNATFFFFNDLQLDSSYFDDEEDLPGNRGDFYQTDDINEFWDFFYSDDGDLYDGNGGYRTSDDEDEDPRSFFAGVIDMSNHTYLRLNGYGECYEFNLNESDPRKKDLNPDFRDWIKNG